MESTLAKIVAANVRAQAALRGMTQTDIGQAIGMGQSGISDRYRERRQWQLEELEALGKALNLDPAELLARPKGFEPLTFWLGADYTLTMYPVSGFEGQWNLFCDWCGGHRAGVGRPSFDEDAGIHVRRMHVTLKGAERAA